MLRCQLFASCVLVFAAGGLIGCSAGASLAPLAPSPTGLMPESPSASRSLSPIVTATPAATGSVAHPVPDAGLAMEPGAYFLDLGSARVTFSIPDDQWAWAGHGVLTGGWQAWTPGAINPGVGLSFLSVKDVYADPCLNESGFLAPALGPTVGDLTRALTELPGYNASAPTDVMIDEHAARYVRMTINPEIDFSQCDDNYFMAGWMLADGYSEANLSPDQISEYWIVDVNGTRCVLYESSFGGTTPDERASLQRMFDSIQLLPK